MNISVVIIVRNEEKRIRHCLEALLQQKDIYNNEIVVVDGSSNDRTRDIVREFTKKYAFIRLIECDSYGYSYQRNRGAIAASGQYILYVSGDARVGSKLIERYLRVIGQGADVVQGTILTTGNQGCFSNLMCQIYPSFYKNNSKTNCEEFSTVNVLIRRDLLLQRGFDENLNSFEDKEWFLDIQNTTEFKRLKGAVVYHPIHENFVAYLIKIHREAVALGRIYLRSRNKKSRIELNFFNWLSVSNYMIVFFLISAVLLIVGHIKWNPLIGLIPLSTFLLYPLPYSAGITNGVYPMRRRIIGCLIVYCFYISVAIGVTRGYILQALHKSGRKRD